MLSPRWRSELLGPSPGSAGAGASSSAKDGAPTPPAAQGPSLSPASRAVLLLASPAKIRRLRYLAAARQGEAVSLCSAVIMTGPEFSGRFPGYRAWVKLNGGP
jgi:hypothetical protein